MKILDRYLIKEFLLPFLYCLVLFVSLYIVIDLFTILEEVLQRHIPMQTLLKYYLAFIPIILIQFMIMPVAGLLATLYVLGNFNRHNEIMAMRASGISLWRLICPFLVVGLILSFIALTINEKIIPQASLISFTIKEERIEKPNPKEKNEVIEDVAFYGKESRMFYVKTFNQKNNTLFDIIILEHDNQQHLKSRLTAKKAVFENGRWKFYNTIIYPLDKTGQLLGEPLFYKEKILDLPEKPYDFTYSQHKAEFMNYSQLKEYITRFESTGYEPTKELVDLHSKISFPFVNFVIIFIGIPFALRPNRGGTLMYVGVSFAIGVIFYGVMSINIALGKGGALSPFVSAWLANIIFSVSAVLMLAKINK